MLAPISISRSAAVVHTRRPPEPPRWPARWRRRALTSPVGRWISLARYLAPQLPVQLTLGQAPLLTFALHRLRRLVSAPGQPARLSFSTPRIFPERSRD